MINDFRGCNWFLSNYSRSPIKYQDLYFPTVEHAFAAAKTESFDDRVWIAGLSTPGQAKRYGRKVELRSDWDRIRYPVMRELLFLKFSRSRLAADLIDTGDHELIEGNEWHDTHWGVCNCNQHKSTGLNYLGRMLMTLRDYLKVGP